MKRADLTFTVGFGNRETPIPSEFAATWNELKPSWHQVHGTTVIRVTDTRQNCGESDGLITTERQIPIGIVTADCVPILIASLGKPLVGAFHAGWKGTKARIVSGWLSQNLMPIYKIQPSEMVAWIGPAIGPCCYEVSEEMYTDFQKNFSELPRSEITPRFRYLDLQKIHELELKKLGFSHVEVIRECTKCTLNKESKNWKFASYRRDGTGVRQYTLICID